MFVCDVIHHVEGREAWLQQLASEMKTGAKLVVVEFREGKLPQGPPEAMKIPKAQLISMLKRVGFALQADQPELLQYQTFLTFRKAAGSAEAAR